MPRATARLLASYGHVATDVRDIGTGGAKDPEIARYAKDNQRCLVTGDWGFADVRVYPPTGYHGIVVVGVPDAASPADILDVLKLMLDQPAIVSLLPGRLAVVERHKIRLRPPP